MHTLALCLVATLVAAVAAEPPSGYNYNRPSSTYGTPGGGYIGGGGGGGYVEVGTGGYTSNEGANVDAELLNKIRQILLREEANSQRSGGGSFGGVSTQYGAPSSQYGVPSTQYGVPNYFSRVVGIDLEGIRQAIQVAQYEQTSYGQSSGPYPAATYSQPSSSYGAPSPSSSYGAPF